MFVSETYVEDCIVYDSLTSNSGKWTIPSAVSSTYSDNGWKVTASSYSQIRLTEKLTSDCSVEFTLTDFRSAQTDPSVIIYAYTNGETTPNTQILLGGSSSQNNRQVLGTPIGHELLLNTPYRIEYTSSTLKVYENNVLLGSSSNTIGFPTRFEIHMGTGGRYAQYKDLKIKPL